jgi:hypothetical protein
MTTTDTPTDTPTSKCRLRFGEPSFCGVCGTPITSCELCETCAVTHRALTVAGAYDRGDTARPDCLDDR